MVNILVNFCSLPFTVFQPISHVLHCFVLACIASRPGQSGRCDGFILEGKELDFYLKKIRAKKGK